MINDKIYDVTKEYTDMYKVTIFKTPLDRRALSLASQRKQLKKTIKTGNDESIQRSVRRSRNTISDYCGVNEFEWFVTFTFNPKKVDRYDIDGCYAKMQGWLWRTHRKHENFKYIIVPEKHKDGAIHFHALMAGYDGKMTKTRVIQDSRRVYNVPGFTFGFTNAQKLDDDLKKTIAYLCKYITKDMALIHNRRRYWSSRNLAKPEKYYNVIQDLFLTRAIDHSTMVNETEYNASYEISKRLLADLT